MKLTEENIADVMEKIESFFDDANIPKKDNIKVCFLLEEALLRYKEKFGEATNLNLLSGNGSVRQKFQSESKARLTIRLKKAATKMFFLNKLCELFCNTNRRA